MALILSLFIIILFIQYIDIQSKLDAKDDGIIRLPLKRHLKFRPNHRTLLKINDNVAAAPSVKKNKTKEAHGKVKISVHKTNKDTHHTAEYYNGTLDLSALPVGIGLGTHYAEIYFGIPVQKASVIIDTGLHVTAVQCKNCKTCGIHTDKPYDLSMSTTVKYLNCSSRNDCDCDQDKHCMVSQSFAEGSTWRGIMVEDLLWFGELEQASLSNENINFFMSKYAIRSTISCQIEESGAFVNQKANGVIGMSQHPESFLMRLLESKRIKHNIFTLCFNEEGGSMTLGGIDYSKHTSQIQYASLIKNPRETSGQYRVELTDFLVGATPLKFDKQAFNSDVGVVIDSGSTDTYVSTALKEPFFQLFKDITGIEYSSTDEMDIPDKKTLKNLPPIQFVFRNTFNYPFLLQIPASQYLQYQKDGSIIGNIHFTQYSGAILGTNIMMNWDIIFDTENHKIGFASADCSATYSSVPPDLSMVEEELNEMVNEHPGIVLFVISCFALLFSFAILLIVYKSIRRFRFSKLATEDEKKHLNSASAVTSLSKDVFTIEDDDDDADINKLETNKINSSKKSNTSNKSKNSKPFDEENKKEENDEKETLKTDVDNSKDKVDKETDS